MKYNLLGYGIHVTCDRIKSLSNVCSSLPVFFFFFGSLYLLSESECVSPFSRQHLNKILVLISTSQSFGYGVCCARFYFHFSVYLFAFQRVQHGLLVVVIFFFLLFVGIALEVSSLHKPQFCLFVLMCAAAILCI